MNLDEVVTGGQLRVGVGIVPAIGEGAVKVNGGSYIEGPAVFGGAQEFATPYATVCIGAYGNSDDSAISAAAGITPGALMPGGNHSPYSLAVSGPTALLDDLDANQYVFVGKDVIAQGEVRSNNGGHILSAKKNFDIPHPTKENKTLRHGSLEGPEHGVYVRGTLEDSGVIELPDYWLGLVDEDTITVQLTGKGRFQRLYVDKIEDLSLIHI